MVLVEPPVAGLSLLGRAACPAHAPAFHAESAETEQAVTRDLDVVDLLRSLRVRADLLVVAVRVVDHRAGCRRVAADIPATVVGVKVAGWFAGEFKQCVVGNGLAGGSGQHGRSREVDRKSTRLNSSH